MRPNKIAIRIGCRCSCRDLPSYLALGFLLFFFPETTVHAQQPYYFGRTKDPAPVVLQIQDRNEIIRFKIPKVYMTFSENWKGGLQTGITIQTIFPSMAPLSATRTSMVGTDVLIINLYSFAYTGGNYDLVKLLKMKIESWWSPVGHYVDRAGQTYRVYVEKRDIEKRKDQRIMIKEYLVPEENDGDIYFDCLRESGNPGVGCIGFMNYGETLSLEFQFRRSILENWRQFREASVKLLNSFRSAAEN